MEILDGQIYAKCKRYFIYQNGHLFLTKLRLGEVGQAWMLLELANYGDGS